MANISCIIVDDENRNVDFLKNLLQEHCPQLCIVSSETDPRLALQQINELTPRLIFLDVEMPHLNGFELLKKVSYSDFEVIFVTAFSHYAVEAFEHNAIGYITKPINTQKLISVVNTVTERIDQKMFSKNIYNLLESTGKHTSTRKIPLSTSNGLVFVKLDEINYCESSGNYTFFNLTDNKKITVTRQLGEYEKLLPENEFIRIHDKYIIHLSYIREYLKGATGGTVKMENGTELPVAARRKDEFLSRFEKWIKKKA